MASRQPMDPGDEQEWLDEQEQACLVYLKREHLAVGDELEIEWLNAPIFALWSAQVGRQKFWVICGDVPTDYLTDPRLADARSVVRAISARWLEVSGVMLQGKLHPTIKIGAGCSPQELVGLGGLLQKRSKLLENWTADDEKWEAGLA
jgi:hypothetical protein